MFCPSDLPQIGIGDLSRNPRRVLERVLRGERLVICRYGHPVATLQPLIGAVTQPFDRPETGASYDLGGRTMPELESQLAGLTPVEKKLLMRAVRGDRILPALLRNFGATCRALKEWELKGLARRSKRGYVITGRGLMLREALLQKAGRADELFQ